MGFLPGAYSSEAGVSSGGGAMRLESASRLPWASTTRRRASRRPWRDAMRRRHRPRQPPWTVAVDSAAASSRACWTMLRSCARRRRCSIDIEVEETEERQEDEEEVEREKAGTDAGEDPHAPSSPCFAVPVAEAVDGLDRVEARIEVQELPAQPLDVAVDRALADVRVLGVALLHELAARLDVAGMAGERLQEQELGDGQRHGGAVPLRGVALQIEDERAAAEDLVVVLFARRRARRRLEEREAPEQHADARHELAHRERLAEIVVRSELEAEDAVELVVLGGDEDDRERLGHRAQAAAELEAVHAGHEDVEDDEIGQALRGAERVPGGEAVGMLDDVVALAPQGEGDGFANVRLVVDDRDGACAFDRRRRHARSLPRPGGRPRLKALATELPQFPRKLHARRRSAARRARSPLVAGRECMGKRVAAILVIFLCPRWRGSFSAARS